MQKTETTLKKKLLYLNWQMWEGLLSFTSWVFGEGHEATYGVKANRNLAHQKWLFER